VSIEQRTQHNIKNGIPTSKKTQHGFIAKIILLIVYKEIITVYSGSNTKPTKTPCEKNSEIENISQWLLKQTEH
jgi:hypothetical protein